MGRSTNHTARAIMHLLLIVPLAVIAVTIAVLPILIVSVREHRRTTPGRTDHRPSSSYSTRPSDKLRPVSRIPTGDAEPIWRQWVEPSGEPVEPRESRPLIGAR